MAKQPELTEPAKTRKHMVNRNPNLSAAAKIVAILEKVDHTKWESILKTVQYSLQIQPELPVFREGTPHE